MKPILFNTEMVRAILDGRKTVTRRVIKPQPKGHVAFACMGSEHGTWGYPGKDAYNFWGEEFRPTETLTEEDLSMRWTPPFMADDILYVRETWNKVKLASESDWHYEYRASCDNPAYFSDGFFAEWRPSIHMPKDAARLFLRVTGVRVERLQDIDDDVVVAEGLKIGDDFDVLWDSTIKPADLPLYGWDANPWVWVIEFERCEKPEED